MEASKVGEFHGCLFTNRRVRVSPHYRAGAIRVTAHTYRRMVGVNPLLFEFLKGAPPPRRCMQRSPISRTPNMGVGGGVGVDDMGDGIPLGRGRHRRNRRPPGTRPTSGALIHWVIQRRSEWRGRCFRKALRNVGPPNRCRRIRDGVYFANIANSSGANSHLSRNSARSPTMGPMAMTLRRFPSVMRGMQTARCRYPPGAPY